jgi:hypothetical protein
MLCKNVLKSAVFEGISSDSIEIDLFVVGFDIRIKPTRRIIPAGAQM